MKKLLLTTALCAFATPALADFVLTTTEEKDDKTMFNDGANKDVTEYFGSFIKNNSAKDFDVKIIGGDTVDTGNGNANTTPDTGLLTDIKWLPDPKLVTVDGFFVNIQMDCAVKKDCDKNGANFDMWINGSHFASFQQKVDGNDHNNGFDESGGPLTESLVTSVEIVAGAGYAFKDVKQVDWSQCSAMGSGCGPVINPTGGVPEPSTWAMGLIGFGLMGAMWRVSHGKNQRTSFDKRSAA